MRFGSLGANRGHSLKYANHEQRIFIYLILPDKLWGHSNIADYLTKIRKITRIMQRAYISLMNCINVIAYNLYNERIS